MGSTLLGDSIETHDRRHWPALLVVAAVLFLLRVTPSAAETIDPATVQNYAREFDVSEGEASEHLETQAQGADVADQLRELLGTSFAGLWFDNESGEFVVPLTATSQRAEAAKRFADAGLEKRVRFEPAQSTWGELEAAQKRVTKAIAPLLAEQKAKTGIDARANAVYVGLAGVSAQEMAAVQAQAAAESVKVEVRTEGKEPFGYGPSACTWQADCDPPFHGGVEISSNVAICTSAFAAIGNQYGNRFVITAGHCLPGSGNWSAQTANGYTAVVGSPAGYIYGGNDSDAGQILANNTWWDANWPWAGRVVIWGPPSNPAAVQNPAEVIYGSQGSYAGLYVCHSGRTTGSSCGTVAKTNVKVTYSDGTSLAHMTEAQGMCLNHGDSGGSVFSGHYAVGIFSGGVVGSCGTSYYTEVQEMESRMGFHVAVG